MSEISLVEVPVLAPDDHSTLVIDSAEDEAEGNVVPRKRAPPDRADREDEGGHAPGGGQPHPCAPQRTAAGAPATSDARIVKEYSRIRVVQTEEEADHRELSIDRDAKTVTFLREPFSLDADLAAARKDAALLVEFFGILRGHLRGRHGGREAPAGLLHPLVLALLLALHVRHADPGRTRGGHLPVPRPSPLVLRPNPPAASPSLIDTLMTSMFGRAHNVGQAGVHQGQAPGHPARLPAVPCRLRRHRQARHTQPRGGGDPRTRCPHRSPSTPCFVLSMNQDLQAFTDQIVKRSLMIYTTTALPSYKESLRHELHLKIQEVRRGLSTNLYREYLARALETGSTTPPCPTTGWSSPPPSSPGLSPTCWRRARPSGAPPSGGTTTPRSAMSGSRPR